MPPAGRPFALALALALALGGCSAILGIDYPPLRDEADGGDAQVPDAGVEAAPACGDVREDSQNCGRCGHSCLGDACREGACEPTVIVTGQGGAFGIGVDDANVFWTTRSGRAVSRASKTATSPTPTRLFERAAPFDPLDLLVDGPAIVFVDRTAGQGTASVFRIPKEGGTPAPLGQGCAPDGNGGLAVDATHAFFTNGAMGNVYRAAKGSGDCAPIVTGHAAPSSVVVDDTSVFFTTRTGPNDPGGLSRVAKAGGATTPVAPKEIGAATGVGTDGEALFVSTVDGRILRVAKDGSQVVELARDMVDASPVVADESGAYWVASGDVWAADKRLGQPRRLASVQVEAARVATDRDRVYWTTKDAVVRVAK